MAKGNDQFVIRRSFDAPPALLFAAFTDPEHLMRWWAPAGYKMVYCKLDLRPHGKLHYCARSADGQPVWGRFEFRKIQVGQRIEFINSFLEETGSFAGWPQETLYNILLMEQDGKTIMLFTSEAITDTKSLPKNFIIGFKQMKQLYNEAFDHLEDYLTGNRDISKIA